MAGSTRMESRKLNIIEYLAKMDDEVMLSQIENLIESSRPSNEAKGDLLTDKEAEDYLMNMVKESEVDYKNGNTYTHEDAQQKVQEWLKNQK